MLDRAGIGRRWIDGRDQAARIHAIQPDRVQTPRLLAHGDDQHVRVRGLQHAVEQPTDIDGFGVLLDDQQVPSAPQLRIRAGDEPGRYRDEAVRPRQARQVVNGGGLPGAVRSPQRHRMRARAGIGAEHLRERGDGRPGDPSYRPCLERQGRRRRFVRIPWVSRARVGKNDRAAGAIARSIERRIGGGGQSDRAEKHRSGGVGALRFGR